MKKFSIVLALFALTSCQKVNKSYDFIQLTPLALSGAIECSLFAVTPDDYPIWYIKFPYDTLFDALRIDSDLILIKDNSVYSVHNFDKNISISSLPVIKYTNNKFDTTDFNKFSNLLIKNKSYIT